MKKNTHTKLWGGAFTYEPTKAVMRFTAGRDVVGLPASDVMLLSYDLWVNKAHCVMLAKTGIIPLSDASKILGELLSIEKQIKRGTFVLDPAKEDVHTNIESSLTDLLGIEVAGKLHTARSRNDQVVTDMKLYIRDQVMLMASHCMSLTKTLLTLSETYKSVLFPGFTHHQHAMVTTFGHVLAGFASMMLRDVERFQMWITLHNDNPLGNIVSYGTTFPINRKMTSELLGFDGPDNNSLDAITNRWEPEADFAHALSVHMNHLSLVAETLMMLATPEFGMITLADQYSTGSSVMPQKKNPDPLEVMKGKAGFAQGQLMSLLSIGKGAFIGYNRDSQWTKYIIMDLVNECLLAPVVMSGVLETMTVHKDVGHMWCTKGFIGTTTVMEQLVQTEGIPMRQAKIMVEKAVKESVGKDIVDVGDPMWQDPKTIISLTKSYGGPGKHSMKATLKKMKQKLSKQKHWLVSKEKEKATALGMLSMQIEILMKGGENT